MVEITSSQRTPHRFTALQQARTSDGSSGSDSGICAHCASQSA